MVFIQKNTFLALKQFIFYYEVVIEVDTSVTVVVELMS